MDVEAYMLVAVHKGSHEYMAYSSSSECAVGIDTNPVDITLQGGCV